MHPNKLVGALGVLVVLVLGVGSVSTVFRETFFASAFPTGTTAAATVATALFVAVVVLATTLYATRPGNGLRNPYW